MGLGFTLALTAIGAVREILGSGHPVCRCGPPARSEVQFMELRLLPENMGVLMMILPPGGFLVAGLLVVVKRMIDVRAGKAVQIAGAHAAG